MNKTIIININGIVFHIEEDAYEVLKNYMTEVKRHFAYTADSEEIVTDIENRIAEMFTERLEQEKKQVILLEDVQDVTSRMGRVSDFETDEEESAPRAERKLYRDTEDRIIGGVCSGLGHYFNIEARWVRVIAFLTMFLGGTGLMIYIILWIVMPRANTRAERMAMKGEEINLQNFKRNFEEEIDALRHNISKAHQEARPAIDRAGSFFSEFFSNLGNAIGKLLKVLVKIAGVFIIVTGGIILFGLIIGLISLLGFINDYEYTIFPLNAVNPDYIAPLSISVFIVVFIPVIALILFALRIFSNRRIVSRTTAFGLLIIWISGLFMGIYYGASIGSQFKEDASFSRVNEIKPSPKYYLQLNDVKLLTGADSVRYKINGGFFNSKITINDDQSELQGPHLIALYIEKTDTDKPSLTQTYKSRGPSFETALRSAQQINYQVDIKDSLISFASDINLQKNELWREQEVSLVLKVPKNTTVIVGAKMNRILENLNIWDCEPHHDPENFQSEWLMTDEGLKCQEKPLEQDKSNEE
ncbi:PspC domain-containing protein [Rubrolithibacter danxiaensis]|uniref:PspC domain-containing protein n=1 Tax=Rubrolithibacter danxiaensis TaxID=3390805 RepID=UPI003BF826D8